MAQRGSMGGFRLPPRPALPPELAALAAQSRASAAPDGLAEGRRAEEPRAAAPSTPLRFPPAPSPVAAAPPQPQPQEEWVRYVDEEGDPYYFNTRTQETTWSRPPGSFADAPGWAAAGAQGDALGSPADGNRRVLVISSSVIKAQSQLILGAARADVTVLLFDPSATSTAALVGMVQAAVPRGGCLAMLGFMTQTSLTSGLSPDGSGIVELVRGETSHTTRRSLRSDATLKQFWREVGSLVEAGGRIDLLKSTLRRATDGAWLLADLEQLSDCKVRTPQAPPRAKPDVWRVCA